MEPEMTQTFDAPEMAQSQTRDEVAIPEGDWQQLWFVLQGTPWSALAVLPADAGIDVRGVAEALVDIGQKSGAADVTLVNGVGARFNEVQSLVDRIEAAKRRGVQVVVACEPLEDSPAMLALTRVATGTLLVVRLGQSRFSAVRKTVEAVGRDRVITSVTLKPRK